MFLKTICNIQKSLEKDNKRQDQKVKCNVVKTGGIPLIIWLL